MKPISSARSSRACRGLAALALLLLNACGGAAVLGEPCDAAQGDLVVTELMVSPRGGGSNDDAREWIEVFNASARPQPLSRLVLERTAWRRGSGAEPETQAHTLREAGVLAPGAYVVIGNGKPGVAPIDYTYNPNHNPAGWGEDLGAFTDITDTFDQGGARLSCRGALIDAVTYGRTGAPAPKQGQSLYFDGAHVPSGSANDETERWCSGGEPYDQDGNVGSPGQANLPCGLVRCRENSAFRDGRGANPGDLVISEVMLDPAGSADTHRYWVELYVNASTPIDLNWLTLTTSGGGAPAEQAVVAPDESECLVAEPKSFVVIAESLDRALNGEVAAMAAAPGLRFSTAMKDQGGQIVLSRRDPGAGWVVVDSARIPARWPDESGRSEAACAGSGFSTREACECDDPADCPADELLTAREQSGCSWNAELGRCEGGARKFSGRTLALDGPALAMREAAALNDSDVAFCYTPDDPAFAGHFLGIGSPGAANHVCGSVVCCPRGACCSPEECAAAQKDAAAVTSVRAVRPPQLGDILVSEVFADAALADRDREWIEIFSPTATFELNGVDVVSENTQSGNSRTLRALAPHCATVAPGQFAVIGVTFDSGFSGMARPRPQSHGGVTPDILARSPWLGGALHNVDSNAPGAPLLAITLRRDGVLLDRAEMPGPAAGTSAMLAPDAMTAQGNDAPEAFCAEVTLQGMFDGKGSPAYSNVCGPACVDDGTPRALRKPGLGELVVSEIYADPPGVDANNDWVELYVAATAAVDLNDLEVASRRAASGSEYRWRVVPPERVGACVVGTPGALLVVGGPHAAADGVHQDGVLAGPNSDELLFATAMTLEIWRDNILIDAAPTFAAQAGASFGVTPSVLGMVDAFVGNDNPAVWCHATLATPPFYGLGSPGTANEVCD